MKPESGRGLPAIARKRGGAPCILCILLCLFFWPMLSLPLAAEGGEEFREPEEKEVLLRNSFHQEDMRGERTIVNLSSLPEKSVLINRTTSSRKAVFSLLLFVGVVAGGLIWLRRVVKKAEERGRLLGGGSKKEWEERLYDEKMALLERVSGGISHDLRNPLGAIKNAVFFLNMAMEDPDPEIRETIEILEMEIVHSEKIINSLTEFSRIKPPVRKRVNINGVMAETLSAVNFPDRVVLENEMGQLPELMADPEQLEKIFRNIIINAIKSMPGGGRLVLRSEEKGNVVAIAAEDTGSGITEEEMERLFEPFFTTRAKGIGLGLTITKDMVQENGGTVEVESRPGEGSTFTVILPKG